MTDETTHLRTLLADATARAERAERTLTEALTRLPSTWGPPEVLRHLLDKAGRCDQAEVRAEHAERENEKLVARLEGCLARGTAEETRANAALAACAEMRAALERMIKYAVEDRATTPGSTRLERQITRANCLLARPDLGRGMVVEREVLERLRDVLQRLPRAGWGYTDAERAAIADLDALFKKDGG